MVDIEVPELGSRGAHPAQRRTDLSDVGALRTLRML